MSNKSTNTYTHCTLQKYSSNYLERVITISWIPSKFAKEGSLIALKNGEEWSDWTVVKTGLTLDAEYVESHKDDYRHQRKASDI